MSMSRFFLKRLRSKLTMMLICLMLVACCSPQILRGQNKRFYYREFPVNIGAGGYITGLTMHPTSPGVFYCRTDVGGAYRWDPIDERWNQLVVESRFPDKIGTDEETGVESIGLDPSNPALAYIAVFNKVYRSQNGGQTFTPISGSFDMQPNNPNRYRVSGERLAVNPNNPNRVLFGSRNEGLWVWQGGNQWVKSDLPHGNPDSGVAFVMFGKSNGGQAPAYAGVVGRGFFISNDGGLTWTSAHNGNGTPQEDLETTDIDVASDGTAYFVSGRRYGDGGVNGVIWKHRPGAGWGINGSDWKEILPSYQWQRDFVSVAVDPFNPERLIVSEIGFKIAHFSEDGGLTWRTLSDGWDGPINRPSPKIPWHQSTDSNWFEHGEIKFDRQIPNRLWCAQGQGVWYAPEIGAQLDQQDRLDWICESVGIEELVPRDIGSAPGVKSPLMVAMDFTAFRIRDPHTYFNERIVNGFLEDGWDVAYSPQNSKDVVLSCEKFGVNTSKMSFDSGETWQIFPSLVNGTHPPNLKHGVIAVSQATGGAARHIVWAPSDNSPPFFSIDDGQNWSRPQNWPVASSGEPLKTGMWFEHFMVQCLTADPNIPGRFLFYLKDDDGVVVETTDGGRTWTILSRDLPMWSHHATMTGSRFRKKEFWFSAGRGSTDKGLWRSQDGGRTFQRLTNVEESVAVSIGPPIQDGGRSLQILFLLGAVGGKRGVFRSDDDGRTWGMVLDGSPIGLLDQSFVLGADQNIPGRVYIGVGGTGFAMAEPLNIWKLAAEKVAEQSLSAVNRQLEPFLIPFSEEAKDK